MTPPWYYKYFPCSTVVAACFFSCLDSAFPNLSDAMLTMIVVIDFSRLSASPPVVERSISQISSSNLCHSPLLLNGGHLIRFGLAVSGFCLAAAWKDWALWVDSWPSPSFVLLGSIPLRCFCLPSSIHFILPWCIFRPCEFLHIFPQTQVWLIIRFSVPVDAVKSVLLGNSFSPPPLGFPWGYFPVCLWVADYWVPFAGVAIWVAVPLPRSPSFRAVNCLSSSHRLYCIVNYHYIV